MASDEREPDEQGEREEPSDAEREEPSEAQRLAGVAEQRGRRLQEGRAISFFGGELPVRAVAAVAVFIAIFLAVWVLLWQLGVGLGLGWVPALLAGAGAVWLYTKRFEGADRQGRDTAA